MLSADADADVVQGDKIRASIRATDERFRLPRMVFVSALSNSPESAAKHVRESEVVIQHIGSTSACTPAAFSHWYSDPCSANSRVRFAYSHADRSVQAENLTGVFGIFTNASH